VVLGGALLTLVVGAIRARRHRFVAGAFGAFAAWCAAAAVDWHWEVVGVTLVALMAGGVALVIGDRPAPAALRSRARLTLIGLGTVLSVAATWSLVGNQALFAGRDALRRHEWEKARDDGLRARALLFWSAEPDLVLGDAAAGLGDRAEALRNYRDAVRIDPTSWIAWLHLAQVADGAERSAAYRRVHELNPREEGLPGQ
jgi:hypothetical protein